jgi:hypothetical protein
LAENEVAAMKMIKALVQDPKSRETANCSGGTSGDLGSVGRPLQIVVPYTNPVLSRAALNAAATLAEGMPAEVILLEVHVVPYPLPLGQPAVQRDFLLQQLRSVASEGPLPVRVKLVLARNKSDALRQFILPDTPVLLVTRKRFWRTAEERLALRLARQGCNVLLQRLHGGEGDIPPSQLTHGEAQRRNERVGWSLFQHK